MEDYVRECNVTESDVEDILCFCIIIQSTRCLMNAIFILSSDTQCLLCIVEDGRKAFRGMWFHFRSSREKKSFR